VRDHQVERLVAVLDPGRRVQQRERAVRRATFASDPSVPPATSLTLIDEIVRPSQKSWLAVTAPVTSRSSIPASASAAETASQASSVVFTSSRASAVRAWPTPTM
jgi:hypothetical protein